jgi:hypothetical protein
MRYAGSPKNYHLTKFYRTYISSTERSDARTDQNPTENIFLRWNQEAFEEYLLLGYDALNALHGVISQKKILFKTTAVKTSNPTRSFWTERRLGSR